MDLYSLSPRFQRQGLIEDYKSIIWTERFSSPGEVQLTLPASSASASHLGEGSFLALGDSKEVMQIETYSLENEFLTVTGNTLLDFFNYRIIRATGYHTERQWILYETTPGTALAQIVQEMCISGLISDGLGGYAVYETFENLSIGDIATGGDLLGSRAVDYGPLYPELKKIVDTYNLGMSLYLDSADPDTDEYSLVFKSWDGVDRTRGSGNEIVNFSPAMDTLANLKELRSVKGFKNACYAFNVAEDVIDLTGTMGVAFADTAAASTHDFYRRTMMVLQDDFKSSDFESVTITLGDLVAILNEKARDALANNNYTKVVDGEIVPQSEYQYGVHYGLGDIVELQGNSGNYQKARITEYIRTKDQSGERAYPTVSVIV